MIKVKNANLNLYLEFPMLSICFYSRKILRYVKRFFSIRVLSACKARKRVNDLIFAIFLYLTYFWVNVK